MNRPDVMQLAMRSGWQHFVPRYAKTLVALQDEVQMPSRQYISVRILEWLLSRDDTGASRKHFLADLEASESTLLLSLKHLRKHGYAKYKRSPSRRMNMIVATPKLLDAADRCWEES